MAVRKASKKAATLHGKALTPAQLNAFKRKQAAADKKAWKDSYRKRIAAKRVYIAKLKRNLSIAKKKKSPTAGLISRSIQSAEAEIKSLQLKIKNL